MLWQSPWPDDPASRNLAIGALALEDLTSTASGNTAVGEEASQHVTTGGWNTAVGYRANSRNATGTHNTAVGTNSMWSLQGSSTTGSSYNTSLGSNALSYSTQSKDYNVGIGYFAMDDFASDYAVAVGARSMSDGSHYQSVAVGYDALGRSSTSYPYYNVAIGYNAGNGIYSGDHNVVIGYNSDTAYNNHSYATTLGSNATAGTSSVSVGYQAGYTQDSSSAYNVLLGQHAGYDLDGGDYCSFIGYQSGYNGGSGSNNDGVGYRSLYSLSSGIKNVAFGSVAGFNINTGSGNVCVGYNAGNGVISGNSSTFLGTNAGKSQDNDVTNRLTTGSNVTCIGHDSIPTSGTATNEITLGDNDITSLRCNVQTISSLSDERDKTAIEDLPYGLDFINDMRPVKFTWNRRDGSFGARPDMGFIAQELAEVEADHSSTSRTRLVNWENPSKLEADYARSYPILVKAVQELSAKCDALEARLATLEGA